jgi:hypothetical protein
VPGPPGRTAADIGFFIGGSPDLLSAIEPPLT